MNIGLCLWVCVHTAILQHYDLKFCHNSAPKLQGLKPALCLQSDRASVRLSFHTLVPWRLLIYTAWEKNRFMGRKQNILCWFSCWRVTLINFAMKGDAMKNNGIPVTLVWPSVVLFSTPCRTTSGLISTDAPQSFTPAFNEEGTRTHTAPTHDRRVRRKRKTRLYRLNCGDEVSIFLAVFIYLPDCGFQHCHHLPHRHQCLRYGRKSSGNYLNHLQKQRSLRLLLLLTERYRNMVSCAITESACLPITVSPDTFFTVAWPYDQWKHKLSINCLVDESQHL